MTATTATIPQQRRKAGEQWTPQQLAVIRRLAQPQPKNPQPLDPDWVAGERYWEALNELNGDD